MLDFVGFLCGWGTWIRTKINGVRVQPSALIRQRFFKTRGKAHVQHQTVKSDFQNRGRAPPWRPNGKAADAANVHGPNGVATLPSSNIVNLAHAESEIKRSHADWRTFYDDARGNVDESIKAVWRAVGDGLINESEAAAIDDCLRSQQVRLQRRQAGLSGIATALVNGKSKLALGWARRRPRRSPDREKSRHRARMLGGSAHIPPRIRSVRSASVRFSSSSPARLSAIVFAIWRSAKLPLSP